jgi:hypothetical protein
MSGFGLRWKGRTTIKDDIYDTPTVYLLYVLLAIVVIVAAAVIAIIRMLQATDRSVAYPLTNRSIAASKGGDFEMVQLWVNLPAAHKAASYQHSGASPGGGSAV